MSLKRLQFTTLLPIEREEAWDFFSNPRNLKVLTPDTLQMEILEANSLPHEIYAGLIIEYQMKALSFLTTTWVTEITHVKPWEYFIDEQRFGPYAFWHHRHTLQSVEKGTLMTDTIHYKLPGKFLGEMLLDRFVKKKLESIFEYRLMRMKELFPSDSQS